MSVSSIDWLFRLVVLLSTLNDKTGPSQVNFKLIRSAPLRVFNASISEALVTKTSEHRSFVCSVLLSPDPS